MAGVVNVRPVAGVGNISSMDGVIHCFMFEHLVIWGVCSMAASGQVSIERPGTPAPLAGTIGMRLLAGDTVKVGSGSSATVYLAGGGLVRVPAGSRIEIPRVGVSAIVLHGVGNKTLRRGVGHIPGTPLPVQDGNVGLAGHR